MTIFPAALLFLPRLKQTVDSLELELIAFSSKGCFSAHGITWLKIHATFKAPKLCTDLLKFIPVPFSGELKGSKVEAKPFS